MTTQNLTNDVRAAITAIHAIYAANGKGLKHARATLENEESIRAHAAAFTYMREQYDSADKEKRVKMSQLTEIRVFTKLMSDAVTHERIALKKDTNDDATAKAKLYARFPFRIKHVKGVYLVLTHAEFDARTVNNRKGADEGAGETGTDTGKGTDKAAVAMEALQAALDAMTADRDAWKARAILAEGALDAGKARKTPSAKVPAKRTRKAG